MAENYLITGYWGEPHVTVENDRGFNAAVFGAGKFVLPVGEMFRAEYIGNNTIRIYDGKLIDNGAVAGIPAGEYIEFMIPEAGQSMKRHDLIVFEYSRNDSTLVESGVFKVISGTETSETAVDPTLTENNLLSNIASFDQMALWRISVNGASISNPEILYNTRFAGERIAKATSTDGKVYTVNLPGVAKLYTGLEITIIPDTTSTTTIPSLNINGLGAVNLKRRITSNTRTTVQSENENFLYQEQPIRVIYNGSVWVADLARANAADIYGSVPVEKGGTGANNAAEACGNLGAIPTSKRGAAGGVASLDSSGKVPSSQLPSMDYIPTNQKGAVNGVATLNSSGQVPSSQLPSLNYIPTSQKGAASGVASLDSAGKVPSSQLPSMDYIPTNQKGAANGVATLDSSGKISQTLLKADSGYGTATPNIGSASSSSVSYQVVAGICWVYIKIQGTNISNTFAVSGLPTPLGSNGNYVLGVSSVTIGSDGTSEAVPSASYRNNQFTISASDKYAQVDGIYAKLIYPIA